MTERRRHVLFHFDAGPVLGGGHAMRCLGLAEALAESGVRSTFVVKRSACVTLPSLADVGIEVVRIEDDADLARSWEGATPRPDWLVVDRPDWDAAPMQAARSGAEAIMAISDSPGACLDCDLLLDSTGDRDPSEYDDRTPQGCKILTGSDYALLRPGFWATRRRSIAAKNNPSDVPRIFVGFGATDPNRATVSALRAVERVCPEARVDVMLGSVAPGIAEVQEHTKRTARSVSLHIDTGDVAALMARADIAIGAAGISSWERCCLALPTIVIVQADNQRANARALARHGGAIVLGDHDTVTVDDMAHALSRLIAAPVERREMASRATVMCDGLGARRVAQRLFPEYARDGAAVTLRPACAEDSETLFRWQAHPDTRRYFRTLEPPARTEHENWFACRLTEPDCLLGIVEHGGTPAGVLRLDRLSDPDESEAEQGDRYEISILVAPDRWGGGIGGAALRLGRRLLPFAAFRAWVHRDNAASHRLFTKAGYRRSGDGYVLDAPAHAYVCA